MVENVEEDNFDDFSPTEDDRVELGDELMDVEVGEFDDQEEFINSPAGKKFKTKFNSP